MAVVVIAYHEQSHLRDCLLSLSRQTIFERLRVVVVKNYAPDGTLSFAIPFQPLGIDIIAIADNIGKVRAANAAYVYLDRRHGEFSHYVSMDGDILLAPDALERMANFLDNTPKVGLVAPRYYRDAEMQTDVVPLPAEDVVIADETLPAGFTRMQEHTLEGCFVVSRACRDQLVERHGAIYLVRDWMMYTHSGLFMPTLAGLGFKLGYLEAARVKHLVPEDEEYQRWKDKEWGLRNTPEQQAKEGYL